MFKLGQMLRLRARWSSSKFQEACDFKQFSRESERAGSQYFRPEISVPPTRCSSNEIVLVDGAPPTRLSCPYVNTLLSYFVK